jgi:peptidoglycan/LPS O-acetylase OafA/YrhL
MALSELPAAAPSASGPVHRFTHIRELDGVRGIAALMVFFHHVCYTSIAPAAWAGPILWLYTISSVGSSGVDLFFTLSGFLITSLLIEARERTSYYHDFYWKRALRILPLYVASLVAVLIIDPQAWSYVLLCALFLGNFAHVFHLSSAGPFWTLAIEEQFYLLWPAVVRRRSIAQIRGWALGIAGAAFLLRIVAAVFGHADYSFTFFHCDGLAAGAFMACWFFERDATTANRARENRTVALCLAVGIALMAYPLFVTGVRSFAFGQAASQTGVTLVCASAVGFLVGHSGQPAVAAFRSPALTFIGLISYAMYMTHAYVLGLYDHLRGPLVAGDAVSYWVRFFSILSGTVAVCLVSRYLIELPAISLRRFVLAKPSRPAPGDPPIPLGNI